ncbi:MAG TPA: ABC transporter ATP-binding protein [Candidatus Limnocylindrales bacterium]|nr:ABC transporter ATP-binding protein [Candidatus Limnocylindrales bacterium]
MKRERSARGAGSGRADATAASGQPAIRTRGLTKAYGELIAVDHLNLEVKPGEVFGLLGPNGAGKTTTILMLLGLSEPTSGRAEVLGLDPTRYPLEVKRQVGYLPDEVGFYGNLTGRQNLRYTAALNGLHRDLVEAHLGSLLEQVGLADAADRPVEQYSRGMRQRLGLADALVKEPAIVILDEPTTAIDPAGVIEVLDLIRSLARDRGAAVLLSSHLLHQVEQICDRVGIFVAGKLEAMGSMRSLTERLGGDSLTLEVGLDGPPDQLEPALRQATGVRQVQRDERDPSLWRVTGSRQMRSHLAADLTARGLSVWQLRRVGDELDEIYLRYFSREGADDGRAA